MIQHGRANGTDIISRDMTLEAVPLPLLSNFSCTVIVRQYLARPVTMAVSTVKTPRQMSGNPPSGQLYIRFIPSQPVETTDSWPEQEQEKVPVREYHWLVIFYSTMKTLTSSGVISFSERPYVYLIYFVDFQWRSSMHQIH